ncbi:50S ribosomal protein L11 methyltransferase [Paludibacter sp. 221]|uniref:50S ribosomal protein L11 methyltransferase n=1 Tax=Paludibacter sp. 221 TaxID=2302939 RepID=UPI0013D0BB14|nr:50S ribosomal protein L11 methyltransferase [Paludibacter sp. 221]NDV46144.1 50S ribosomal protein L11 methyltransferase [Paludibacter sp. 221]
MNYIEISISITPFEEYIADVIAAELGEIGFDSFVPNERGLVAYVQEEKFDKRLFEETIKNIPFGNNIEYSIKSIPQKNWNEEWEKNFFQPIVIGNECVIHSSFHKDIPQAKYDIVIDPKMSFGTGHHETTSLMIEEILKMDLHDKKVLDMGCGTSVLAILASMRGAKDITAIDIDPWCTENSQENIELNNATGIKIMLGGAELLQGMSFDIIIANINRNILLADMSQYAKYLTNNGELYMSGFYKEDIPVIEAEANKNGLKLEYFREKNNWVVVKTIKR